MSTLSIRGSAPSSASSPAPAQGQTTSATLPGLDFGALLTQQMASGGGANQPALSPGWSGALSGTTGGAGSPGALSSPAQAQAPIQQTGGGGSVPAQNTSAGGQTPPDSASVNSQTGGQSGASDASNQSGKTANTSAQDASNQSGKTANTSAQDASHQAGKTPNSTTKTAANTSAQQAEAKSGAQDASHQAGKTANTSTSAQQAKAQSGASDASSQGANSNAGQGSLASGINPTPAVQIAPTVPSVGTAASGAASSTPASSATGKERSTRNQSAAASPDPTSAALQGGAVAVMALLPVNSAGNLVSTASGSGAQSAAHSVGPMGSSPTVALSADFGNSAPTSGLAPNSGVAPTDSSLFNLMGTTGSNTAALSAGLDPSLVSALASGSTAAASTSSGAQPPEALAGANFSTQMTLQLQAQSQVLGRTVPAGTAASNTYDVSTPFGSSQWGQDLNQKITWMSTSLHQSAELTLNPPDLGPLKVVLQVSGDQATALFTSAHAAVRDAVQQALPQLRSMMADNGITLGNATVSDQNFARGQGGFSQGQDSSSSSRSGRLEVSSVQGAGATATLSRTTQGLVDTFA